MKKPSVSVIMVDGGFRENFSALQSLGRQTLNREDYELLWVEYYDEAKPGLRTLVREIPNARLITLGRNGIYHSSYCFNEGIRQAEGEFLFIPDADVIASDDFLETAIREHQDHEKLVIYFHRADEPQDSCEKNPSLEHLRRVCRINPNPNYGTCVSARKHWFARINGYEQHPVFASGFHANGLDVYTRFRILGLHVMWHPNLVFYHPWHPHTGAGYVAWDVQQVFVQHRVVHMQTSAFCGLDVAANREIPAVLAAQLAERMRHHGLTDISDLWKRETEGSLSNIPGRRNRWMCLQRFLQGR